MLFLDCFFGFGALTLGFLYIYVEVRDIFVENWKQEEEKNVNR